MQAALRSLGSVNAKERVAQFVAEQQHQQYERPEYEHGCFCDHCDRQQVLGMRRIRRSEPQRRVNDPQSREGTLSIGKQGQGKDEPGGLRSRKRPMNETARRGQGKIGRAAHLRPGRITFRLNDAIIPDRGGKRSQLEPPSQGSHKMGSTGAAPIDDSEAESSWHSDEHSLHSNHLHREAQLPPSLPREATPRNDLTEHYMYDFYTRNPAAKANGWLALPHHRYLPPRSRVPASFGVDRAARGIVQSQQQQVLGLLPGLKRRKKHR